MLRKLGVLTAPLTDTGAPGGTGVPERLPIEASCAAESEDSPEGSAAAISWSSSTGRTPMLWKPTSCHLPLPSSSTTPRAEMLEIAAPVNSAPLWQLVHPPLPVKRFSPRCSCELSALPLPCMNWSKRELSDTSVDSYI